MLHKLLLKLDGRIFSVAFALIFLILISFFYNRHALNIHFVDEEENIVLGSYILKGEKLYSGLFSQHQPSAYIISSFVQKVTNPDSIYTLISRHRQVMILWSFIWGMFFVVSFPIAGFAFVILYEMSKIFIFGDLFLAEALVVYPLSYLVLVFYFNRKSEGFFLFFITFIFGFLMSTLLYIWPLTLFLYLTILFKLSKLKLRANLKYIIAGLLPVILQLPYLSLYDYFYQTFYVNAVHYIPSSGKITLFKSLFYPILTFDPRLEQTDFLEILRVLCLLLVVGSLIYLKKKKGSGLLFIFLFLGLAVIRFVPVGSEYYGGFHLLPWLGILIASTVFLFHAFFEDQTYRGEDRRKAMSGNKFRQFLFRLLPLSKIKKSADILFPLMALLIISPFTAPTLIQSINKNERYYINYSRQFDFGEAVRIMKTKEDTLFVVPDEFLIYWQGNVKHASKYLFFYDWMVNTPIFMDQIVTLFKKNPPTYFYCNCQGSPIESFTEYYLVITKDNYPTNLYVLPQKAASLNQNQLNELKFYNFKI